MLKLPSCCWPLGLCLLVIASAVCRADSIDKYRIGSHGQGHVIQPDWFKQSLLDLQGDLEDALDAGKQGIIVLFSQENCSHCQAFIETTLKNSTIRSRVQRNYDVIGLDIFNDNELTYIDGSLTSVKNFAETVKARLTPTLLFLGREKEPLVKIVGFYPPEKFSRVLDYVEGKHYKRMKLREYLLQANPAQEVRQQPVAYDTSLFETPSLQLNLTSHKTKRPLLVVFENPACAPCTRFHDHILKDKTVREMFSHFRTVQMDASNDNYTLTTPDGTEITPRVWADSLQLNYDIAVVFFDAAGKEVHRIDSEFGKDRFVGSMQYVLEQAYLRHEQFLQWRKEQAMRQRQDNLP